MKDHEVALMSPDQTAGETLPDAPALLRRSDVFCMAPWASVNIQQNGDVLPCCYANHDSTEVLGNLRRSRLSDVWNSEATRRLRLNMLQGRSSPACAKCYAYERSRFPSLRSEMNRDFAHLWPAVAGTGPDGTAAAPPRFLDIRFSNVCNFKCRYCGVYVSTAWYADHKRMGRTPPASLVQTPTRTPEDLWREIEPLLPGLERIYFTGGEPLLAPQTYQLLERLIERRAFHVTLQFSTNLSLTRSNGRDIFDLWNRFDRVEVGASLDAMGARGEFIRKNQNWEETVRNRERMIRASPKAVFAITPTMTALNVLHLPDFHADWVRRGFIAPDDIHSNLLFQPEEYSVQILPAALKRRAEEKYASHAEWLRREYGDLTGKAVECFRGIVDFMNARDGSSLLEKFRAATRTLDALRKESITAVFPELKEVFESSGASGISADPPGGIQTVLDDHFPQELGASREGIPAAKAAVSFSRALRAVGHRTPAQAPTAFRRLAGSKVFCLLPWTHLDVRLDGVYSCHASDRPLGKLAAGGVSAMWNSEPLRRLRLNMLAGKESPQCAGCYAQERAGGKSPREWYNAELAAFGPLVDATGLEGSLPEGVIPYLQLEHSNVCNFKCRCCDASKSTAWHADQQRLSGRLNGPVVVTPSSDTSLAEDVRRLLPTAAWIRFNGGEPLLSGGHYEILTTLLRDRRFDVRLSYLTNFSVTRHRDLDILAAWSRFLHVDVGASLDGSGARGEYLRRNQSWERLLRNREALARVSPRASFSVAATLSAMNVLHLPDFHRECIEKGFAAPEDFHVTVVSRPEELSIRILPRHLKDRAAEKFENHVEYLRAHFGRRVDGVAAAFRAAVDVMRASDDSRLLERFRRRTRALDELWGTRFETVFPELAELMKEKAA